MSLISVIIPVYNSSKSIEKCLESACNQTFKDFDIIIVDDGSTDNSVEVMKKYFESKQDVIRWKIIRQPNGGPSKARNNGVKASESEYIAFLDSDDYWSPDHLKRLYDFMSQKKCDFVCTNKTLKHKKIIKLTIKNMIWHCYVQSSTMLVRRNIFLDCEGFNEKKKYSEDYQLWLTICAKKYLAYYIPYRDVFTFENKAIYGQSGLSSNLWAMEQGELDNYKILRDMKCISLLRYLFAIEYSYLKFIIRKIVVSLRHVLYSKKQLS